MTLNLDGWHIRCHLATLSINSGSSSVTLNDFVLHWTAEALTLNGHSRCRSRDSIKSASPQVHPMVFRSPFC